MSTLAKCRLELDGRITSSPDAIELTLLLEAIYQRYGYDFRGYSRAFIARRVEASRQRLRVAHLGELQHRVLMEPELFDALLMDLVVPVSDMFRDPTFFRTLRERIVPFLRTYPELKIWHAGCSSGEEVYANAISLLEEGLLERTQIYATDLDPRAIELAREGVYPEAQIESYASNYAAAGGQRSFDEYVVRAYGSLAIKEELRKKVVFFQHDLATDFSLGEMHVIVCRNVLIYFGSALRARAIDMFHQSLTRGGFLCLGSSETLSSDSRTFTEFSPAERIYRRGPA